MIILRQYLDDLLIPSTLLYYDKCQSLSLFWCVICKTHGGKTTPLGCWLVRLLIINNKRRYYIKAVYISEFLKGSVKAGRDQPSLISTATPKYRRPQSSLSSNYKIRVPVFLLGSLYKECLQGEPSFSYSLSLYCVTTMKFLKSRHIRDTITVSLFEAEPQDENRGEPLVSLQPQIFPYL